MTKLIIVHEGHNNAELLLNFDQIIWACSAPSAVNNSETTVTLIGNHTFSIHETIQKLLMLSQA